MDLLQLRSPGVDPRDMAESARRLYCGAVAHIALTLGDGRSILDALQQEIGSLEMETSWISSKVVSDSSPDLNGATLAFHFIHLNVLYAGFSWPIRRISNHLTAYSIDIAMCSNHRFLSILSGIILQLPGSEGGWCSVRVETLTKAYRGEMKDFWEILNKAFQTLLDPESRNLFDWDVLLTNVLQCVELLVADERTNSVPSMNHNFELLRSCETVLRSPRCPEEARQLGRKLRIDVIKFWAQVYGAQRYEPGFELGSLDALQFYLSHLGNLDRTTFALFDDIEVLRLVRPLLMEAWGGSTIRGYPTKYRAVFEAFDGIVAAVSELSRQKQINPPQFRDPDQCWCHWREEPPSVETAFRISEEWLFAHRWGSGHIHGRGM